MARIVARAAGKGQGDQKERDKKYQTQLSKNLHGQNNMFVKNGLIA